MEIGFNIKLILILIKKILGNNFKGLFNIRDKEFIFLYSLVI
jgi:hypothetical protein